MSFHAGDSLTPKSRIAVSSASAVTKAEKSLELHHVGARRSGGAVEARHWLIGDDHRLRHSEAVELRPHGAAIGAEHADFDIVAGTDVAGKLERPRHAVEVVASRAVEAELH